MAWKKTSGLHVRVLISGATVLGPGKVDLLEAIARTGSISAAARAMGMSYRRAWLLVDAVNRCFRANLVEASTGGAGGGGATVTPFGHKVLARYRAMEIKARDSIRDDIVSFGELLSSSKR
jgi:molybdate transport system regulatory protein